MAHDTALREVATVDSAGLSGFTMLVGRDAEITALGTMLGDCKRGKGIVAAIRGPIASGKTALLQDFARQAVATGAIFLGAAGSRAECGLPFGILDQLFRSSSLPAAMSQQVADLIKDRPLAGMPPGLRPEKISPMMARVFDGLLDVVVQLSQEHPVVVAVDDIHHADVSSLQCLSYLARRAGSSRILMVLTECTQALPADHRRLYSEILCQGNCRCISLAPLSLPGVVSLLSQHLESGAAKRLASSCQAMTGGNPLLVTALGQDALASGEEPPELIPGGSFRSAVVTCLHRHDQAVMEVAQAVAVLGEWATPGLLAELLEISAESAALRMNALRASKLLEAAGQFRHEAARRAVLEDMTSDERAAMHGRAAQALYKTGAAPAILAGHLVDAHGAEEEWAVSALQEASERAVADGDASRAIAYLRRAESGCSDARQRAAIRFALASAEWAISPEGAARHLPELVTDAHQGRLDSAAIGSLAYCLLWMGDTGRAAGILGMLDTHPHHIRFICPELAKQDRNSGRPVTGTDNDAAVILAERTLRERGLNDPTLASLTTAFMSLICEDMLDRSAFWCNALMQDSGVPYGGVLRKAVLTGFLAMIETRRGDLQDAENHARTALDMLTRKAWGVAIGAPLSSLLLTSIASGRQEDAAAWLRVPVPEEMFRTPYGLLYLYARGEYYLATACPQAALADFTDCGNRMVAWDLDQPGLVPWRTKAAEVYLAMGDNLKARELCRQQLAQAGSRYSRTRGISLRALALTSHPGKRTALLRESVEVLRDCGAWLELAYTFSELSNTHLALGEDSRAHWAARQARNLAERCGAQTLEMTLGKRDREPPEADNGAGVSLLDRLSDAERRVAVLAACGYTNIQIAHKLYITVSTVEQHLTRVYRKLEVAGRAELPVEI